MPKSKQKATKFILKHLSLVEILIDIINIAGFIIILNGFSCLSAYFHGNRSSWTMDGIVLAIMMVCFYGFMAYLVYRRIESKKNRQ